MGVLTAVSLLSRWAGWAVDRCLPFPPVDLGGPLTGGPRVVPGPVLAMPVTEGLVPAPQPALGAPADTSPAGGVTRTPSEGASTTGRGATSSRLAAYDCLWIDDPRHRCVSSDGQPARPGGSCYQSAALMSQRDFPERHPDLLQYAIEQRIIEKEEVHQ